MFFQVLLLVIISKTNKQNLFHPFGSSFFWWAVDDIFIKSDLCVDNNFISDA